MSFSPGNALGSIGQAVSNLTDMFKGGQKPVRSKTEKPNKRDFQNNYPWAEPIEKRIIWLLQYYYNEGSFEKIQFARKWMRNALIFQGYHELEWSEINVSWDIMVQDSGDYAFPNNYYRTLLMQGVSKYIQQEPLLEPQPSSDDFEAQGAAKDAKSALDFIKKTVKYDYLRVLEGINLRLFGNSFRFAYYSKDPRFGYVTSPVYEDKPVVLSQGSSICPTCGQFEGNFQMCPACGMPIAQHTPPMVANLPTQAGTVQYPKGEVCTEVVNPLEIYVRSSSYDLWHAPFLVRNRVVDRLALQAAHPDLQLHPVGDEGGGEAYSTGGDLGLIYLQSLADLPGDPTQFAAWYERATAAAKALLIEGWLRPSTYFFDKELIKKFPTGLYGAKTGDTLLEGREDTIEDHWSHYVFQPVPGRMWGDGDDDIIPGQLKLDEIDRLILRNQGYNSVPMLAIDSQRIDKNDIINDPSTIIEVKPAGKPVTEAYGVIQCPPLSQETWQWRMAQIQDMQFHAKMSPAAFGQHEEGVNTFGGQETAAAKSDNGMLFGLTLWRIADEMWATQALKLASKNWLDDRVHSVFGLNGRWEFNKLKGASMDMDKLKIDSRLQPIDPSQQDAMSQSVAAGALDPQDPRVKRKMMELFHLPLELDQNYDDQKAQWREIEEMKQGGQPMPLMIRDNHMVHADVMRKWLNSDEGYDAMKNNPQLYMTAVQHLQNHMISMAGEAAMHGAIQGAGAQAQGAINPQPGPEGPGQPGELQGEKPGGPKQEGKKGGQVPKNPVTRQQRAQKGQAAKPHRPQPPEGNQHHIRPTG